MPSGVRFATSPSGIADGFCCTRSSMSAFFSSRSTPFASRMTVASARSLTTKPAKTRPSTVLRTLRLVPLGHLRARLQDRFHQFVRLVPLADVHQVRPFRRLTVGGRVAGDARLCLEQRFPFFGIALSPQGSASRRSRTSGCRSGSGSSHRPWAMTIGFSFSIFSAVSALDGKPGE